MSSSFDLVIHNGRIVTPSSTLSPAVWIGCRAGKIATLSTGPLPPCDRFIDAEGAWITPGGVDSHVHLSQLHHPAGTDTGDSFLSGTRSAIAGGTTTILAFANQQRHDESLFPVVDEYHRRAAGQCYTDYAFHVIMTNPTRSILDDELPVLVREQGITSIKVCVPSAALARLLARFSLSLH